MNILDEIIAYKKIEVEENQKLVPLNQLMESKFYHGDTYSLAKKLAESQASIIAEFKRKSPSVKDINIEADPRQIIPDYNLGGAAAISVLTDKKYFGGALTDLEKVRSLTTLPILRKDFIIDEFQIHEAKASGADLILLIGYCLERSKAEDLTALAHSIGLEVIFEIHKLQELDHMPAEIDILGVNNRNLTSFEVDYKNAIRLLPDLPEGKLKISESGIHSITAFKESIEAGYKGCLIGEYLMKENDPTNTIQSLLKSTRNED